MISGPYLAVESVPLSCVSDFWRPINLQNYFEKMVLSYFTTAKQSATRQLLRQIPTGLLPCVSSASALAPQTWLWQLLLPFWPALIQCYLSTLFETFTRRRARNARVFVVDINHPSLNLDDAIYLELSDVDRFQPLHTTKILARHNKVFHTRKCLLTLFFQEHSQNF